MYLALAFVQRYEVIHGVCLGTAIPADTASLSVHAYARASFHLPFLSKDASFATMMYASMRPLS